MDRDDALYEPTEVAVASQPSFDAAPIEPFHDAEPFYDDELEPTRSQPVGWASIVAVLSFGIVVALVLSLGAQFAAGFMVEDFCYSVEADPAAWQPMSNPYPIQWFGNPPACYRAGSDGSVLVATDTVLAWKLFFGTVVAPTAAGLFVSAVGFRLVSRRRIT